VAHIALADTAGGRSVAICWAGWLLHVMNITSYMCCYICYFFTRDKEHYHV
jgi:hypothetical protein